VQDAFIVDNTCSDSYVQNCKESKCCQDPTMTCFRKDNWWAACKRNCTPGLRKDDPSNFKGTWSCEQLGGRPPQLKVKRSWFLCSSNDTCGAEVETRRWRVSPPTLAAVVGDFSNLPGVPEFWPTHEHWKVSPPWFRGSPVKLSELADFARDLLTSDPFGTGDAVPYVDFNMLGEGKVVAITQRQLAFLVVNSLLGNTAGAQNGLNGLLRRCKGLAGHLYSLLSFLAILARELGGGKQGSLLAVATPRAVTDEWKERLSDHMLVEPTLCLDSAGIPSCALADFMAGGTRLQAVTDIAGANVGGGAGLCELANTQEESLVQFYSEVIAFSFFAGGDLGLLPVPLVLLGARRYLNEITGQSFASYGGRCGRITSKNWLNENIGKDSVWVQIGDTGGSMATSSFMAVASSCTSCLNQCTQQNMANNNCDVQRRHLDGDIGLWYQAYEASMYASPVRDAFRSIVRRIGTGPWGAGEWYGDSQQSFLAIWLATTLLGGPSLDYYAYSHFCENPGNQCFILGGDSCRRCVKDSLNTILWDTHCGHKGVADVIQQFRGRPAAHLHKALGAVGTPPGQVFDLL